MKIYRKENHKKVWYDLTEGETILARFNSLEEAALVLRYLEGAEMPEEDMSRAKEALAAIDKRGGAYNE